MKRLLDFTFTVTGLIFFAPVILLLTTLLFFKVGHPIFFTQIRPGFLGKPFRMVKFRTMTCERDASGDLLSDAERLTSFGRFMRASSLDELPEIWNVLKGDMSLVGPRPLLMEYLPLYTPRQARRHEVKPGLTGWAQAIGRNELSWEEKFELDVWYLENQSFRLDLKIIWMTLCKVIKKEGITHEGSATMERFRGSDSQMVER